MTRALHTLSATASARTTSSAKTPAHAFTRRTEWSIGAFARLLGDEARSARTVGDRWVGMHQETEANACALATGCALD